MIRYLVRIVPLVVVLALTALACASPPASGQGPPATPNPGSQPTPSGTERWELNGCQQPVRVREFRELLRGAIVGYRTASRAERLELTAARHCARDRSQARTMRRDLRDARRPIRRAKRAIAPHRQWLRAVGDCENGSYGGASLKSGLDAYNPSPFYGRYQFTMSTWQSVGGIGDPRAANWLEQAYRAVLVLRSQGYGAWPVCG